MIYMTLSLIETPHIENLSLLYCLLAIFASDINIVSHMHTQRKEYPHIDCLAIQ